MLLSSWAAAITGLLSVVVIVVPVVACCSCCCSPVVAFQIVFSTFPPIGGEERFNLQDVLFVVVDFVGDKLFVVVAKQIAFFAKTTCDLLLS